MLLLPMLACDAPSTAEADTGCVVSDGASWDAFGEGFFTTWCRSCHSATASDRRGAPVGVDFDSAADVWTFSDAIGRTVLDQETMPVGGGLSESDRALLTAYLACPDQDGEASGATDTRTPDPVTAPEIEALLDAVLVLGAPRAEVLWREYIALLEGHAEPDCPFGWSNPLHDFQAGMEGCSTPAGWTFIGLTTREETVDASGTNEVLNGDAGVEDPTGTYGAMGGAVEWWASSTSPRAFTQAIDGTWGWAWGDGWITAVPSVSMDLEGTWADAGIEATARGGITVDDASAWLDVAFDAGRCPTAPASGSLAVRYGAGDWATVVLAEDCSGCGDASDAAGAALGQVCGDWHAWMGSLAEDPP